MNTNSTTQNVLISGGTGFVGGAITSSLESQGYAVKHLTRSEPSSPQEIQWNPGERSIPTDVIEWADIVINLAGASIAGGWWTEKRKEMILQSRLNATFTLAEAIAESGSRPSLFISASAVGFYGDRPGQILTEADSAGDMFLSDVCAEWEAAADPARAAGVRVVHPRLGVVLDGGGGMLPLMSIPFKLALGGKIGGDQYMAWIDLQDLVRIFTHIIDNDFIAGPANAVAPQSTTNVQFTKALGGALNRPTIIPVPKAIAGFVGGELARELLLADQHVKPQVLEESGFVFDRPTIQKCLNNAFNKKEPG